ncbi:MAG: ABC transporter permease [Deltaproteobacteria bacterium]|nr:ABC transporter permease [Deltaproteobacteria bacterium]
MRELVAPALAIAVCVLVGNLLILAVGQQPLEVWSVLAAGTWGNGYGIGQVLFKATPLALAGLSVAIALNAGLFNIGAEGQLSLGALATAVVGLALPRSTPWPLALFAAIGAGVIAGAVVGAIPGVLKARFGAHEVIGTIMLNFIVLALINWLVAPGRLAQPESQSTAPVIAAATIPRLSSFVPALGGSAASLAALLAVAVAWLTHFGFRRTTLGYELVAFGLRPAAAEAGGIRAGRVIVVAMALSGGVAGLVGANNVLGYKHYFEAGFSGGIGFMGLAVALLGRNHPLGILLAALLFGTLSQGALAINGVVPKELIDVLQAIVILAVVAASSDVLRRGTR